MSKSSTICQVTAIVSRLLTGTTYSPSVSVSGGAAPVPLVHGGSPTYMLAV